MTHSTTPANQSSYVLVCLLTMFLMVVADYLCECSLQLLTLHLWVPGNLCFTFVFGQPTTCQWASQPFNSSTEDTTNNPSNQYGNESINQASKSSQQQVKNPAKLVSNKVASKSSQQQLRLSSRQQSEIQCCGVHDTRNQEVSQQQLRFSSQQPIENKGLCRTNQVCVAKTKQKTTDIARFVSQTKSQK